MTHNLLYLSRVEIEKCVAVTYWPHHYSGRRKSYSRGYRKCLRYSLATKQLIKHTCTIPYTEINFNQIEPLVGESSVLSFRTVCLMTRVASERIKCVELSCSSQIVSSKLIDPQGWDCFATYRPSGVFNARTTYIIGFIK